MGRRFFERHKGREFVVMVIEQVCGNAIGNKQRGVKNGRFIAPIGLLSDFDKSVSPQIPFWGKTVQYIFDRNFRRAEQLCIKSRRKDRRIKSGGKTVRTCNFHVHLRCCDGAQEMLFERVELKLRLNLLGDHVFT